VVAAPGYLAGAQALDAPEDLARHRIIGGPAAAQSLAWQFERGGEKRRVELVPRLFVNDTSGAIAAAAGTLGVTSTTLWACERELQSGELVLLLPEWRLAPLPVHAYFPMGAGTRKAARVFIDFVSEELARRSRAQDPSLS
jgi:DNA-binding transcriptional LysR family regulator